MSHLTPVRAHRLQQPFRIGEFRQLMSCIDEYAIHAKEEVFTKVSAPPWYLLHLNEPLHGPGLDVPRSNGQGLTCLR